MANHTCHLIRRRNTFRMQFRNRYMCIREYEIEMRERSSKDLKYQRMNYHKKKWYVIRNDYCDVLKRSAMLSSDH